MNLKKIENWLKLNGVLPQNLSYVSQVIVGIEETINENKKHSNFVTAIINEDWNKAKTVADNININHINLYKKYMNTRKTLLKEEIKINKVEQMAKFRDLVTKNVKLDVKKNHLLKENQPDKKKVLNEDFRNIGGIVTMPGIFMGRKTGLRENEIEFAGGTEDAKDTFYIGNCSVFITDDMVHLESKTGKTAEINKNNLEEILKFLSVYN